jgi:hypothetical protein
MKFMFKRCELLFRYEKGKNYPGHCGMYSGIVNKIP